MTELELYRKLEYAISKRWKCTDPVLKEKMVKSLAKKILQQRKK